MKWLRLYFGVLRKYAVFNGRASRYEFWNFIIINLALPPLIIATIIPGDYLNFLTTNGRDTYLLFYIFWIPTILPALAVAVRRLHDTGKTGRHVFLFFILAIIYSSILIIDTYTKSSVRMLAFTEGPLVLLCVIYFFILSVLLSKNSQIGDNIYGKNPYDDILKIADEKEPNVFMNNTKENTVLDYSDGQTYKFCTKCGFKNLISDYYCKKCGEKI